MLTNIGYLMGMPKNTQSLSVPPSTHALAALNPEWELLPANYTGTGITNNIENPASGAEQSDYDTSIYGTISIIDGKIDFATNGDALNFAANTTFINGLHHPSATNNWTIFMRLKSPLVGSTYGFIITKAATEGIRARIEGTTGKIRIEQENNISQSRTTLSTNSVTPDVWTNVIISYDGVNNIISISINGVITNVSSLWYAATGTPQLTNAVKYITGTRVYSVGMLAQFVNSDDMATIDSYLDSLGS